MSLLHAPLSLNDNIYPLLDLGHRQRREAEPRAATLHRGHDLVDVVADDAKAHVLRILLDNAAEGRLGGGGHHVGLVEDDELVALREQRARFREVLDLLADDVDAAVIRRVQL